jgi:hypothetical protein
MHVSHECSFLLFSLDVDNTSLGDLLDGTKVKAWISGPSFMVEAIGTAYSVAEVGEQFAWIGSALRTSPYSSEVAYSVPRLEEAHIASESVERLEKGFKAHVRFSITFSVQQDSEQQTKAHCQCWHDMFRNPLIVKGYPIPRRLEHNTGLEMPINMMAGLVGTRHVNVFDGKLFIKGHVSMLIPRRRQGDLLLWHFLRLPNGERISYYHAAGPHIAGIDMSHLSSSRHVVGWCSQAKFVAGKHSTPEQGIH